MKAGMTLLKCILVLVLAVGCAEARKKKNRCSKDHALVGKRGNLITKSHDVAGVIRVLDDCSFRAILTYDGTGPDVFWYGAKTVRGLRKGVIMDGVDPTPHKNRRVKVTLPEGTTWDDVPVLSVWCREFGVNFGHVVFSE